MTHPDGATEQQLRTLRSVSLFADLPDDSLRSILSEATEFEAEPGHVLIEAHREGTGLFIIEEGAVVVEGHKRVDLGPGDFIGELALLTSASRTARVQVTQHLKGLAISRAQFRTLLEKEPSIALHMLEALAARMVDDAS